MRDDEEKKHGSHGGNGTSRSGSAHSHSSGNGGSSRDKSLEFNSMIDDSGKLFGVLEVSPETKRSLDTFGQGFLGIIRKSIQNYARPIAKQVAEQQLGLQGAEALRFANKATVATGAFTLLSPQVFEFLGNAFDTSASLTSLSHSTTPLKRMYEDLGESGPILSGRKNGIVDNARGKIMELFTERSKQTLVGTAAAIPNFLLWYAEERPNREKMRKMEELEELKGKSKEEQTAWFEKQLGLKMEHTTGLTLKVEDFIAAKRKQYVADWETFKKGKVEEREREIAKKVGYTGSKKNFSDLDKDLLGQFRLPELTTKDPDVTLGSKPTDDAGAKEWDRLKNSYDRNIKAHETKFKKLLKEAAESDLKREYVQHHGAFDETWETYRYFGVPTYARPGRNDTKAKPIRDQIIEEYKELAKEYRALTHEGEEEHKPGAKGKKDDHSPMGQLGTFMVGVGGGLLGDFTRQIFGAKNLKKFAEPTALDRILHLKRELEKVKTGQDAPEQIPGIKSGKEKAEPSCGYARTVFDILQQHQVDSIQRGKKDYAEIGERYIEKLARTKWDDKAIQRLTDDELNPLEYFIKHAAKRLKDGRLDPMAMVYLAGDDTHKVVRSSGKDFGPADVNCSDEKACKEALLQHLDRISSRNLSAEAMDEKAVGEALGRFSFSTDELKAAFGPEGLKGGERAFFFALVNAHMPDPKVLCRVTGLESSECEKLREEVQERFDHLLTVAVAELADMAHKDPKALEKLELTENEKKLLGDLAARTGKEGIAVSDATKDKAELRNVETAVANAVMELDGGKGQEFWQRVETRMQQPMPPPEAAPKADAPHESDKGMARHDAPRGFTDREHERDPDRRKPDGHKNGFADREHSRWDDENKDKGFAAKEREPKGHDRWKDEKHEKHDSFTDRFRGDGDKDMLERVATRRKGRDTAEARDPW